MARRTGAPVTDEVERLVSLIESERRRQKLAGVHSLWRVGDGVRRLRSVVPEGQWGRTLVQCGARVGLHPSSLDEAARAAAAFRQPERRALLRRFEASAAELSPSHVVELARAPRNRRRAAVDLLLRGPHSVRELRSFLREKPP